MTQLTREVKTVLCKTAVAAGTTDITDATVIDMANWEGVRFIFAFGTITAGAVTHVAVASAADNDPTPGSEDLEGSKITVADDADDKLFIIDVFQPRLRYLRPFVDRGTQNAVVNSIIAECYGPRVKPVTADDTVSSQELHISPAIGTA